MTVYSAQQIKFEFLSYIKEFGARPEEWRVGAAPDAQAALFEQEKVDRRQDLWLWKPALSPAAASIVYRYLTEQLHVPSVEGGAQGSQLFIYKLMPKYDASKGTSN